MRRRTWAVLAVAVFLLAHSTAWWVLTGRMLAGLPAFAEQAAANGWQIEAGSGRRGGWPLAATVRLPRVRATRLWGTGTLRWTAESVVLSIAAADPGALRVAAEGSQTVAVGDGPALAFQAERETVRVPFSGAPTTLDVRSLQTEGLERAWQVQAVTAAMTALALSFTATGVQVTPALSAPFDGGLTASSRVLISPAFPVLPTPGASAAAWQGASGHVDVASFVLDWGTLHVTGHGGGGLDGQLQPMGRADLQVQGATEMLAAAAQGGLVPARLASAVRAVLQLLTLAARGGPVPIPVVLAEQRLTVAGFPLVRVPELRWDMP